MPSYEMYTKDFAKQVLAGTKKLMKMKDVNFVSVKKYDELSVKGLYNDFLELEGMKEYFPDKYAAGRCCDRDFMFNIANTLHEDITQQIIKHAQTVRHATESETQKNESILMSEHWQNELASMPMTVSVS